MHATKDFEPFLKVSIEKYCLVEEYYWILLNCSDVIQAIALQHAKDNA